MRAARFVGGGRVEVVDVPRPAPGPACWSRSPWPSGWRRPGPWSRRRGPAAWPSQGHSFDLFRLFGGEVVELSAFVRLFEHGREEYTEWRPGLFEGGRRDFSATIEQAGWSGPTSRRGERS